MKKRILALFLACMMIVSVIAVPAFAETDPCAEGHDKIYTSIEEGKKVPTNCTETTVCSWTCKNCDETGYERVTGAHSKKTGLIAATCTTAEMVGEYCLLCDWKTEGEVVDENAKPLGHNYVPNEDADDYKAPTCTENGSGTMVCTRCGDKKANAVIETTGHSLDTKGVIVEATCAHPAGVRRDCLFCDYYEVAPLVNEDGTITSPATGHEAGEPQNKDATCATKGYTGRLFCVNCGEVIKNEDGSLTGTEVDVDSTKHTAVLVGDPLKKPSCGTTGVGKFECKDCEKDLGYMSIPAEHTYGAGTVVKEATGCTDGTIEFICIVCKKDDSKKTETITAPGEHVIITNYPMDADCNNNQRVAARYCTVCKTAWGVEDVKDGDKATGHTFINKIDCEVDSNGKNGGTKPALPTCTATGWGYTVCRDCGVAGVGSKETAVTLPALGHAYDMTNGVHSDATCATPAGIKYTCTRCKGTMVEAYTDPKLKQDAFNHKDADGNETYEALDDIIGTCATKAVTGRKKCTQCGVIYAETEGSTNPNNHVFKLTDTLKAATCTTDGIGKFTCTTKACNGYYEYQVIEAEHTWDEGVVVTTGNCGVATKTKYTCLVEGCGKTETRTGATVGQHTWVQKTPVVATCLRAEGTATVCYVCKQEQAGTYVATSGKNPLGHNMTNYINCVPDDANNPADDDKDGKIDGKVPVLPTCYSEGWGYIKCSRCGTPETNGGTAKDPIVLVKKSHTLDKAYHVEATCTTAAGTKQDCKNAGCDYSTDVVPYTGNLAQAPLGHKFQAVPDVEANCMYGNYNNAEKCTVCGAWGKITWQEINPNNHVWVLSSTLKEATCTTVGVGQYVCKNPKCDVTSFRSIPATHSWNEKSVIVSESGNALYNPCTKCDAVKVFECFTIDNFTGATLDNLDLNADVEIIGTVNKNVMLYVEVSGVAGYTGLWIEVNGEKVTGTVDETGVYAFVYETAVSNIDDTFEVVVKGEKYGVVCTSEAASYEFELLDAELEVERHATTKIENATASFTDRGVLIGETVKLLYFVEAPETASVVLKKYGTDTVYETVELADLTAVAGMYVVEVEVAAADWDQVFSASVVDAEGNVISNTNHYSVAQYAANNIKGTDKLSTVLSAMMQAIAD